MAVIQHLTHTAIFTWMLVEGIHLYIKLVKVFSVKKLYITYIIIGWGKIFAKMDLLFQAISFNFHERRSRRDDNPRYKYTYHRLTNFLLLL